MATPTLYIFAGLPASGKTTLAQRLATDLNAVHLRIDTIEQAMRDLCNFQVEGEGYRLAYRIAADNLRLGLSVVADSCNTIELTRREWEDVAKAEGAEFVNIEILCSHTTEHRQRVEGKVNSVPNLQLPTWNDVLARAYHSWSVPRVEIDTAGTSPESSYEELRTQLRGSSRVASGRKQKSEW